MKRAATVLALLVSVFVLLPNEQERFTVVEATIPALQVAMAKGQVTSRQLVEQYLIRIATYEDKLNAALAVNPAALQEADVLDRERAQGDPRSEPGDGRCLITAPVRNTRGARMPSAPWPSSTA